MAKKLAILSEALDEIQSKANNVKKTVDSIKVADEEVEASAWYGKEDSPSGMIKDVLDAFRSLYFLPDFLSKLFQGKKVDDGSIETTIRKIKVSIDAIKRARNKIVEEIGQENALKYIYSEHGLIGILEKPVKAFESEDEEAAKEEFQRLAGNIFALLRSTQHLYGSIERLGKHGKFGHIIDKLIKAFDLHAAFDVHGKPLHDYHVPQRGDTHRTPESRYEQGVQG